MKTLYISYFGMLKHLSQSQVIPYLRELSRDGLDVTLLSFEERFSTPGEEDRERKRVKLLLRGSNIDWYWLRYHKRPSLPATIYDVWRGVFVAAYLVIRKRIQVIHVRNHVPSVIGLLLKRVLRTKLLFDMRGVMAEEYVDAGRWKPNGIPFRITKWVERQVFKNADAIVMLTSRIRSTLRISSPELQTSAAPIEVIPCCVDLEQYFSVNGREARAQLGLEGKLVITYSGSLGGWYLLEELVAFVAEARRVHPETHFLVLTQSPHQMMESVLKRSDIESNQYSICTVPSHKMPSYLAAADFGISLIKPCFSKISSSPTKIGEYLASGLPFLTTSGIGDLDDLVQREKVGVVLKGFDKAAYREALAEMMRLLEDRDAIRRRCRRVAAEYYSLATTGRQGYRRIYEQLGWEGS